MTAESHHVVGPPAAAQDALDAAELRSAATAGARVFAVTRFIAEASAVVGLVVLARLVPPAEVGRAAIPLVFTMVALILTYEGFGSVLVQRPHLTDAHVRTSMTLSIASGVVLAAAVAGTALAAAKLGFDGGVAGLTAISALAFPIGGFGAVSRGLAGRRLDFQRLGWTEVLAGVMGTATAIGAAVAGLDAAALVLGGVATVAFELVGLLVIAPPPRPGWSIGAAKEIVGFGAFAAASGLAYALRRNADYLVLGTRISHRALGLYFRSFQVGCEYQSKISSILLRLGFPLLARAQSVAEMQRFRSRIVAANAFVIFPLLAALAVTAPSFVPLTFGPQWDDAVGPIRLLTIAGAALAVLSGADAPALALGRPRAVLLFNGVFLAAVVVTSLLAGPHGLMVICAAVAVTHVLMLLLAQWWLLGRVAGVPFRALWHDVGPATVAGAVAVGILLPFHDATFDGLPHAVAVVGFGAASLLVFAATMRLVFPAAWRASAGPIAGALRSRRPAAGRAA